MHVNLKAASWLVLAVTAVACSRTMFALFDDPEGPNLLVVSVMALVIYLPSVAVYRSNVCPPLAGYTRIAAAIVFQIVIAAGFYLGLR